MIEPIKFTHSPKVPGELLKWAGSTFTSKRCLVIARHAPQERFQGTDWEYRFGVYHAYEDEFKKKHPFIKALWRVEGMTGGGVEVKAWSILKMLTNPKKVRK